MNESVILTDFTKICRTCLIEEEKMFAVSDSTIISMLQECVEVQIQENDQFPQKICKDCWENLQISFQFKQQCELSNAILHKLLAEQRNGRKSGTDLNDFPVIDPKNSQWTVVDRNKSTENISSVEGKQESISSETEENYGNKLQEKGNTSYLNSSIKFCSDKFEIEENSGLIKVNESQIHQTFSNRKYPTIESSYNKIVSQNLIHQTEKIYADKENVDIIKCTKSCGEINSNSMQLSSFTEYQDDNVSKKEVTGHSHEDEKIQSIQIVMPETTKIDRDKSNLTKQNCVSDVIIKKIETNSVVACSTKGFTDIGDFITTGNEDRGRKLKANRLTINKKKKMRKIQQNCAKRICLRSSIKRTERPNQFGNNSRDESNEEEKSNHRNQESNGTRLKKKIRNERNQANIKCTNIANKNSRLSKFLADDKIDKPKENDQESSNLKQSQMLMNRMKKIDGTKPRMAKRKYANHALIRKGNSINSWPSSDLNDSENHQKSRPSKSTQIILKRTQNLDSEKHKKMRRKLVLNVKKTKEKENLNESKSNSSDRSQKQNLDGEPITSRHCVTKTKKSISNDEEKCLNSSLKTKEHNDSLTKSINSSRSKKDENAKYTKQQARVVISRLKKIDRDK